MVLVIFNRKPLEMRQRATPGRLIASQTLQLMVTSVQHVDGPIHTV